MGPSSEEGAAGYGDLYARVVDAIRYVTAGQSIEEAAAEVLQRLRDAGLPIPDRPYPIASGGERRRRDR